MHSFIFYTGIKTAIMVDSFHVYLTCLPMSNSCIRLIELNLRAPWIELTPHIFQAMKYNGTFHIYGNNCLPLILYIRLYKYLKPLELITSTAVWPNHEWPCSLSKVKQVASHDLYAQFWTLLKKVESMSLNRFKYLKN